MVGRLLVECGDMMLRTGVTCMKLMEGTVLALEGEAMALSWS